MSGGTVQRVTVVGAGAAGVSTAMALRALGFEGAVTVIGGEHELPYDRPPLSKEVLSGKWTLDDVRFHPASHYPENSIDLRLGQEAVALDPATKTMTLANGATIESDVVVVATGVRPRPHPIARGPHVFQVSTATDVESLRTQLVNGAKVAVIGAGFLGLELAASAVELGCQVDLIELANAPLAGRVPAPISTRLASLHAQHGVRAHFGRSVTRLANESDSLVGLELDDGSTIGADLVVVAIGTVPNVEWLESSGLDITGGLASDPYGRTAAEGIYAVGDVAKVRDPLADREFRREHRSNASESAQNVAALILNTELPPPALASFWTDQYDVKLQFVGAIGATSEFEITEGSLDDDRFSGLVRDHGRAVGAFAWNSPRSLTQHRRRLIDERASATF